MVRKSVKFVQQVSVVVAAIGVASMVAGFATAQGPKGNSSAAATPQGLVKLLNSNTDDAMREVESHWRARLAELRKPSRVEALARRLVSYGQKLQTAGQFLGINDTASQRIRDAVREEIGDERKLIQEMKQSANETLSGLCEQDIVLLKAMGKTTGLTSQNRGLCKCTCDSQSWDRAFDPLVETAVRLSQQDAARTAAVFSGSNLISDGINDSAREAGVNPYEDGTLGDFLADLVVNVVVGIVADAVTDSSAANIETLTAELRNIERNLLDGPKGLLTSLRSAAEQHKQARLRLIGSISKGGVR